MLITPCVRLYFYTTVYACSRCTYTTHIYTLPLLIYIVLYVYALNHIHRTIHMYSYSYTDDAWREHLVDGPHPRLPTPNRRVLYLCSFPSGR